ncbi:MAG: hypothetical protein EBV83_06030 [Verrucomicrobia bacterium]|nr:hypothetical protein [Verrucomicrobiota bacterium]
MNLPPCPHGFQIVRLPIGSAWVLPRAKKHLLAGWQKLNPKVPLRLAARAFAHWDTGDTYRLDWRPQAAGTGSAVAGDRTVGHWRIDPGAYEIRVGSSSADVVGSALLVVSAD